MYTSLADAIRNAKALGVSVATLPWARWAAKRAGWCAALGALSAFSCPEHGVIELIVLPLGRHNYSESDSRFNVIFRREVFVPGDTMSMTVIGNDGRKNIGLANAALRFASSMPAVATVSEAGVITAHAIGEARLLVSYGSVSDTIRVVVVPRAAQLRVVLDPTTIRIGFTSTVRAIAYDTDGAPFPRTYSNLISVDHPEVADGHAGKFTVSGRGAGTASVTALLAGQDLQASTTITVNP